MLLMCHLFIGLIIGLVAFKYMKDRRVVLLAAIGSILPDLIDKPLGHIILNGSVDYGRIYAHSGLFFIAILVMGIAYHQKKGSWIMMGLAAGILSHLALDSMWELPVTVFYPLLGDFGMHHFPNYIGESLMKEIRSAYEWIFGASILAMLLFTYKDKLGERAKAVAKFTPVILRCLALLLVTIGILSIIYATLSFSNPLSGETSAEENLITGLAAGVGGSIAYRIWTCEKRNQIRVLR
ncbi:MAG: metal-dependent hydrolase [Methanomassiliicoccales archaeon]|jgi:membrane-bound metal-dependent hydrolase YbcI (DUF457 family)